jgi:hypothetical protein
MLWHCHNLKRLPPLRGMKKLSSPQARQLGWLVCLEGKEGRL